MPVNFKVKGILDNWKKGDFPNNQMVEIVLGDHSLNNDGLICITPQLASNFEVDEAIDSLIEQLEIVRNQAKKNIRKTNKKIRDL